MALEWLKSGFLRFGTWGRSSNTTRQNPVVLGVLLVSPINKYTSPHTRQQGVGKGPSFLKIHQSVYLGHRYTKVYLLRIPIKAALEIRAAWAKERDELEANESKATPSGGKAAFSIERRAVTVVFD